VTAPRQAIVILGMHRSGTSALAGTVARLGMAAPATPLSASKDNPSGFYESAAVVQVNHRIIVGLGCAWNLCLGFYPERLAAMNDDRSALMLRDLLVREFGGIGSYVLKDPRLCMTMPAWLPALRDSGAAIKILIVARHPAEVVDSLSARNGQDADESAPNWLHHMLEADVVSRGLDRAVVLYDDLMDDWRGCLARAAAAARITWPRGYDDAAAEIQTFLAGTARHHRAGGAPASIGPAPVAPLVDSAWAALRKLARAPEDGPSLATLDTVRPIFAEWRRKAVERLKVVIPGVTR
jgi:hypothetical protein